MENGLISHFFVVKWVSLSRLSKLFLRLFFYYWVWLIDSCLFALKYVKFLYDYNCSDIWENITLCIWRFTSFTTYNSYKKRHLFNLSFLLHPLVDDSPDKNPVCITLISSLWPWMRSKIYIDTYADTYTEYLKEWDFISICCMRSRRNICDL